MNTMSRNLELKDLVRTVALQDAVSGKGCTIEEEESGSPASLSQLDSPQKAAKVNVENFAIIKTACKIVKSAPYRLDHYAFVLCLSGESRMTAGHYNFTIRPNSIHFVLPGMINAIEQTSEDFQVYMVLFNREFFADMYVKEGVLESMLDYNLDFPPISNLDPATFERIKGLMEQMDFEYHQKDKYHQKLIQSMLMQLFYLSGRIFQSDSNSQPVMNSRGYQLVQQFKKAVDQDFMEKRTVQEYADDMFVTAGYLGEIIKKETGETAIKVIHRRIYLEALYLLNYSHLSIKEISDTLNFDTPSHFSRFFKQFAGYTPTSFKSNIAAVQ